MVNKRIGEPKSTRAERLSESIGAFQFKTVHERYASDDYWEKWQLIYENLGRELKMRKMVQSLARREKDHSRFCKAIAPYAKGWCAYPTVKWPASLAPLNVQAYKAMVLLNSDSLIHPEIYSDSWGRVPKHGDASFEVFIRQFGQKIRWLGVRVSGAKPKNIHDVVKTLLESEKIQALPKKERYHNVALELQRQATQGLLTLKDDDLIRRYSDLTTHVQKAVRNRLSTGQYHRSHS